MADQDLQQYYAVQSYSSIRKFLGALSSVHPASKYRAQLIINELKKEVKDLKSLFIKAFKKIPNVIKD